MADDAVRDIPEEMVEKAAAAMAFLDGFNWDKLTTRQRKMRYLGQAKHVLSAALAGRQVVDAPDDGHCSKCGQPFSDEVREVVLDPRLPFDARDRIERTLRASGHTVDAGAIAHRIMLALTNPLAGSGSGEG